MEKILVVEDNKTLAKLIAKKINLELGFEVEVAYNFLEAKLFLKRYSYFLTLIDLNLPDSPNGEIVDYVLESGNRVIVLSGNIDKTFRANILKKNIIDYVNKGGVNDINFIINTIARLKKNQNHKILLVDDSMVFRKQMTHMLENMFFKVITVAHGEEALGILDNVPDISLVLTDYHMPVMDGLELTTEIRKKYTKNDLTIITISGDNDEDTTAMFLKIGANDYIKKPFSKEEFSCRINNSIEALENIHAITNNANRDFLTGLYNRRYFFNNMYPYFEKALTNGNHFAIAMIDIDFFKKINDTYGHEMGDKTINKLADILRANTSQDDIVARFGGEEFCIVLKNKTPQQALSHFENLREKVENSFLSLGDEEKITFTISIGVLLSPEDTLDESINQADMLLYNAKQNGRNRIEHN
ncbi:response regulator receiver modulated diguanylate cyclase [Sulfurimonas denitrificans DSM 1251]|uniref:diguanylate cyclase n=1 Tax=Sulfurimonas denitrificans (strain ATCC 33889 / DSM 1251) TaxID=326298 RepID=Q30PM7_SULDN|nr:diguanylate cyclase [Sulfurimonas denitrificans]ABB45054.1 response regulator receiver modulated diguanylate cyclase [Sulfurimonas denitrificans DSM 1251]MDD3442187.1 diguanylate cyclase [Sulfurimonas denitrificans]